MKDANVYFTMDVLKSKVVPVVLQSDIKTMRQYDIYGIPMLDPSSVTIFGPQEVIDSIKMVKTELLTMANVSQNIIATVPLDLCGGQIHSNVKEVKAEVQVEKYTEMDIEVPIRVSGSVRVRFFPETMSVKCLVAVRDYSSITPEHFSVSVDKGQMEAMQPLLDVHLASWPPTVQILSTHPDKVEYLIEKRKKSPLLVTLAAASRGSVNFLNSIYVFLFIIVTLLPNRCIFCPMCTKK